MRKICVFLICIIVLFVLGGCNYEPIEGEIYNKEYEAEYTYTQMVPITINKRISFIPRVINEPEKYQIYLKIDDENNTKICVDKEQYEQLEIGMYIKYDRNNDLIEVIKKEK